MGLARFGSPLSLSISDYDIDSDGKQPPVHSGRAFFFVLNNFGAALQGLVSTSPVPASRTYDRFQATEVLRTTTHRSRAVIFAKITADGGSPAPSDKEPTSCTHPLAVNVTVPFRLRNKE